MKYLITSLPDDHYGVHVENEMDELRLLWLVNKVGEEKLRNAVAKIKSYYPDTKPFVSKLLKRFRLKVPPNVFRPVKVPIYYVYVFKLQDSSEVKIGYSFDPIKRVFNLIHPHRNFEEVFDLERSCCFLIGPNEEDARWVESAAKKQFANMHENQPSCIAYSAGGRKEWFNGEVYDQIVFFLSNYGVNNERSSRSLWDVMRTDLRIASHERDFPQ